ncbi:hypothetical protein ES708_09587 [subsurface metagenome]
MGTVDVYTIVARLLGPVGGYPKLLYQFLHFLGAQLPGIDYPRSARGSGYWLNSGGSRASGSTAMHDLQDAFAAGQLDSFGQLVVAYHLAVVP